MRKARNKKISLLMAIVFLFTVVVPFAGTAFAATSYDSTGKPTVSANSTANLGQLYIKIDPMPIGASASALISLPEDYVINNVAGGQITGITVTGCTYTTTTAGFDTNEFQLDITKTGGSGKAEVFIPFNVYVPDDAEDGEIIVTIDNLSGSLSSDEAVVGFVGDGTVTVSAGKAQFMSNSQYITFTLKESAPGALQEADDSVKFTLPKGFTWTGNDQNDVVLAGDLADFTVAYDSDNDRVLYVEVDSGDASTVKSTIRFEAEIEVNELDAKYGDVEVKIGGDSDVTPSSLIIAKYGDYGVEVTCEEPEEILAGRYDVEVGDIEIEETAPGSLVENRTVLLTLPSGAKWTSAPTSTSGTPSFDAISIVDHDTLKCVVDNVSTSKAGKITLKDLTVSTAVDFPAGDLVAEISGSAGLEGEVVIAKVKSPIAATADAPKVKIGVQKQAAGKVVITEAEAEALIKGEDLIIIPAIDTGVTFATTPNIDVTEGDLEVTIKKAPKQLTISIDAESTEASTIEISDIFLTVDRSYPEGEVRMLVRGDAVDEVNDTGVNKQENGVDLANDYLFDKNRNAATVVVADCSTPAPGDAKMSAQFVLGSTTYTVNGVEQTMDVAPYAKDGRTYLPVRYVGYALGVEDANILFDSATQTVTLVKGDKVVQITIGSKNMFVNGATIAMDVAPEAVDGRTMLPFRWIAWAFGASVEYDAATQTVSMEL